MKFLGITFAPLYVPLDRRLQTLAAATWMSIMYFGPILLPCLCFSLFFTRFWWLDLLYMSWIYLDRHTRQRNGRSIRWFQSWRWWYYFKQYFPARLHLVPNFTLDSNRNYLFCCFPHGTIPVGPFNNVMSQYSEFHKLFPNFVVKTATLDLNFFLPLFREFFLWFLAGISCSTESLHYVLSRPEGGQVVLLWPGGIAESLNSNPGEYKIMVKNRKGFVKVALRNGSPLVPVISFGECELFEQIQGSVLHRVQEFIKKYLTIAPLIINGRGFFQYSFGFIPQRIPVTTVVGEPIEVARVENPTNEQIEELHNTFLQRLHNLFEDNKHSYLENPEDKYLELE